MGGDEPTARQSVWSAAGMQPDPAESGRIYGLIHNPDPEPREPMRATPVDRYQSDVIIPDMGAGKYWYVDPRAGLAQRPAQVYDPMSDTRSTQSQLKLWEEAAQKGSMSQTELQEVIRRLGLLPQGTQPSL